MVEGYGRLFPVLPSSISVTFMQTLKLRTFSERLMAHSSLSELLSLAGGGYFPIDCTDTELPLAAVVAAALSSDGLGRRICVVLPGDAEAEAFAADCATLGVGALLFPWWKAAAYRPVEPRSSIFGERAAALAALLDDHGPRIIVASQRAAITPVPPRDEFEKNLLRIRKGDSIDSLAIADKLTAWGYLRVPRVSLPGEFALRGEVLDVYMPGDEFALRVVFEFDEVEELRLFEPVSQASQPDKPATALLRPARELIWNETLIERLGLTLASCPKSALDNHEQALEHLLDTLRSHGEFKGEENYFPLAWSEPAAIFDYLSGDDIVIALERERLLGQSDAVFREYSGLYRKALLDAPVPPPERILIDFDAFLKRVPRLLSTWSLKDTEAVNRLSLGCEAPRSWFGNINYFKEELETLLKSGYELHVFAENAIQAERIASLLHDERILVHSGGLSAGFTLPQSKLAFIHESEIFGRRRKVPKSLKSARSRIIDTFVDLSPGDFVVHVNYGIGRFVGIERMKVLGNDRDYVKIEYADDENIFVPIEQANLVQRFIGNEGEAPRLDRIGSKSWENRKNKVKKSVEDLAERLIRIYSRRKMAPGFAFPPDGEWQTAFEAAFPYEETVDQLTCIDDVKRDMESPRPMDRLVCGDVGYGKTEIAMRAAFKAVMGGKQVAFLAPTTILAEQHYENCIERFRGLPVSFGMLSRFVDKKDQKVVLQDLAAGRIDVVVGTHRILQKDMVFKDLGLLIVDEEQRFGVKDKERLKEIRASIDCLTLTATPIPRTLHMSMLKIRDLSVLTTPPINRHPIQTVVDEYQADLIAKAIRREVEREGQVFFLHNRVQTLDDTRAFIQRLVPEVMVESAHGQMSSHELEDIMHRFIHKGFHVLVSTTIIENGIDIPNVNTIIIDRADMYGISQLYQLRGRVGRSDRLAYAYLFYPDGRALSELAMKRLQIISDFTELGSGFKIAMKDLEVRGAGNLLGREQSGEIMAVGFDLYLKLLDDAVARLSQDGYKEVEEPYLELDYSGFIPDNYIGQPAVKMEIYKKIASILGQDDLDALLRELEDRFGPLPEEAASLLALAEIRILCRRLSVASLKESRGFVTVEFSKVANISIERLLRLMKESGQKMKLDPNRPNVLMIATGPIGLREKSEFIREKLAALAG